MRVRPVLTATGEPLAGYFEPEKVSYTSELGSLGQGSLTLQASEFDDGELGRLSQGHEITWVFEDDQERVVFAGFVVDANWDGQRVVLNLKELGQLFGLLFMQDVYDTRQNLTFNANNLTSMTIRVCQYAMSDFKSVVFPSTSTGSISNPIHWWRFLTLREVLDEIQAEPGAPLLQFVPRWDNGTFRWDCKVGAIDTTLQVVQAGTPADPSNGEAVVTAVRDFKANATSMYVIGNGQEAKTVWGRAGTREVTPAWQRHLDLQVKSSWGTVESASRANVLARGLLQARRDSVEQWQIKINNASGEHYMPGQTVEVHHPGDAFITQGNYQRTIISVQAGEGIATTLTVQEVATQADRAQSGLEGVLRRLQAAETQASNRASTTIDEIRALTDRAQKAAEASQAKADAAAKAAATAQTAANNAASAARTAQTRADAAYSYAGRASSSASSAASSASVARSAAATAQAGANRANHRINQNRVRISALRVNTSMIPQGYIDSLEVSGAIASAKAALGNIANIFDDMYNG